MRVFSVPVSVPFLRTVIAALVNGRLVDGFEARAHPERLAQATLYLPTRRAGRMAREMFLDELGTEAVLLPRIVALGDIDEDELAFAEEPEPFGGAAPRGRDVLVSEAMRPSNATERWQRRLAEPGIAEKISLGMTNLAVIEAENSEAEALAIAVAGIDPVEPAAITGPWWWADRRLASASIRRSRRAAGSIFWISSRCAGHACRAIRRNSSECCQYSSR